ncbi:MAG TPA: ABC-type transport auxiliary lipoprotein family protein [Rhodocyclaceae bacterium]|nr:ABC-type transport auxiliary lipoprotein family protein [Rhodocyclaceae bacterium]
MKKLLLLSCLALSACLTTGKRGGDAGPAVYDLGPPAVLQADATGLPPLAVEIRAPYWLDALGIQYRLAYAEPGRLRDYSQSRWAAPPATLMQQRLAQQLGLVPVGQGGAACLLRIDLDEFSQTFVSPQASQGILQARMAVLDRGRKVLAEQAVKIEKPAPSQDSRGGMAALSAAVGQLGGDIGRWRRELAASGALKSCGK